MRVSATPRLHLRVTLALTLIACWLASAPPRVAATGPSTLRSVAVTTVADTFDGDATSFDTLASSPGSDRAISLREALAAANNITAGTPLTITFNLPLAAPGTPITRTLAIDQGPLPILSRGDLRVDATTQPGSAPVVLDGGNRNWVSDGVKITSPRNQIRGLTISNFLNNGILLHDSASDNLISDVQLVGNQYGVLLDGAAVTHNTIQRSLIRQNSAAGIQLTNAAHANMVGGSTTAANTIRANGLFGIVVAGTDSDQNIIRGNTLTAHLPTASTGQAYAILLSQSSRTTTIDQNRIAGNQYGIRIDTSSGNQITGNLIGLAKTGLSAEANTVNGILIGSDATNNLIGGDGDAGRNVISGNSGVGIAILGAQNTVRNSYIGLGSDGTTAVANGQIGILLYSSATATRVEANVIGANLGDGIRADSKSNTFSANLLGLSADGRKSLPNGGNGILIRGDGSVFGPNNWVANQSTSGVAVTGANIQINANVIESNGRGICITANATQVMTNTIRFNGAGITDTACESRGGGVLTSGNSSIVSNNIIHNNVGAGVDVLSGTGNRVQANSITENSAAGISLRAEANNRIAPPLISEVRATLISGTGCPRCQIEVFTDDGDEGRTLLGKTAVGSDGHFALAVTRAQLIAPHITATATDQAGSTSSFALPFTVPLSAAARAQQIFLPLTLGATQ